jgi:hypothetical protein
MTAANILAVVHWNDGMLFRLRVTMENNPRWFFYFDFCEFVGGTSLARAPLSDRSISS